MGGPLALLFHVFVDLCTPTARMSGFDQKLEVEPLKMWLLTAMPRSVAYQCYLHLQFLLLPFFNLVDV